MGDVVSVEFPFSDLQTPKRRPALVLASSADDLLMARITTHPLREASDVALNRWSEIGLPRASTVRLMKLITIDHRLVHYKIGRLHSEDGRAMAEALPQLTATIVTRLPGSEAVGGAK